MKCNLALHLLRESVMLSVGEGDVTFALAWFKKYNNIPNDTFYRHVNSLIEHNFIVRVGRDKYRLHWMFFKKMRQIVEPKIESEKRQKIESEKWKDFPF